LNSCLWPSALLAVPFIVHRPPPPPPLFPYTTLFRSVAFGVQTPAEASPPESIATSAAAASLTLPSAAVASLVPSGASAVVPPSRSEEHTSELQSRVELVCRLLLEKKKKNSAASCARS